MRAPDRPSFQQALAESGILGLLAAFDPEVIGTPPLGIDLPSSDIDIVCCAPEMDRFTELMWRRFAHTQGFALRQWCNGERAVIASFHAHGWPFEVFASPHPVRAQAGWRHFEIERRLLELGGAPLRRRVMEHRHAGLKTEPAFAAALGIAGDPYRALLDLFEATDEGLRTVISRTIDCD